VAFEFNKLEGRKYDLGKEDPESPIAGYGRCPNPRNEDTDTPKDIYLKNM